MKKEAFAINNRTPLIILGVALVALVVFFVVRGLSPETPTPDPGPGDGQQTDEELETFDGTVFYNTDELQLDNSPLLDKGLIYLPMLELAEFLDVDVNFDVDSNSLLVGEEALPDDAGVEENVRVFLAGTEVTPASIIAYGDDFFVSGRELAPLMGIYFYENFFANAGHIMDEEIAFGDGTYTAVKARDARGWAPEATLTIAGGQITSVSYEEYNEEREAKFESAEYLENWTNVYPDVDPVALRDQFLAQLVERQSPAAVDLTSGATGSYLNFVELASTALAQSQQQAVLPPYPDGEYVFVGAPSAQGGWMPYIEVTVSNGLISSVTYDDWNENQEGKRDNEGYLSNWRNAYPDIDPVAIVSEREQNIIQTQDPNTVDATTGATAWGTNLKKYIVGGLDHGVKAALDTVSFDRVYVFFNQASDRGDRAQLLLALLEDEIVLVDFSDYRNGVAKKFDPPYLTAWQDQYPDVEPLALLQEMETLFADTLDPDELDAVSGATGWRDSFQVLARRALDMLELN